MNVSLRPLTISLHALGGQGGGVVADWLVETARAAGWIAQSTSVPGVAQRTGATVYYLELFKRADTVAGTPVLALMPTPGDVDLVVASELMEAGRALMRGLITDRTTVVASNSRVYSISEKSSMGDGRLNDEPVLDALSVAARRLIAFDMEQVASEHSSVVSSVLLGAIAGSGVLPFERDHFEQAIRLSGIAVETNLSAFAAGFLGASGQRELQGQRLLPETAQLMDAGISRLLDYQDSAYAQTYRDRIARISRFDEEGELLTRELARYLALWMSYEDTVRVADLKIRSNRIERIRGEVSAGQGQIVAVNEYLHPRTEEICESLPAALGAWALRTSWARRFLDRFAKGRHIESTSVSGFMLLYLIAAQRSWRRKTLRFARENAKIEAWVSLIERTAESDFDKAVEITRCQRLIKGYGDTYDRGWENFSRIMDVSGQCTATTIAQLRSAALADEKGVALGELLAGMRPTEGLAA